MILILPSGIVVNDADCGAVGSGRSPLERLVEGEDKWETPDHLQSVLPQNWGGTEPNRSVACMVLKAKTNDRRKNLAPFSDEFRELDLLLLSIRTATAGSDVVQSGRPIFDDFFQHLWPYIGNNTANVVFQMVKSLWLIRIDQ
ncbi:hypothetical protein TNCV_4531001 [Trichonephila clavipes]|nr:hypothetical protein TNCV_4531001 [Trichonephila clavipes]